MTILAVAYLRVSTEGQLDGFGLDAQEARVREYCDTHGITLVHIVYERGVSGAKSELEGRIGLIEVSDYIGSHPEVTTIVIPELSRLARDLMIQERILSDWESRKWTVLSTKEPDLDGTDPTRKFIRQVLGAVNEYDRAMIVARMRAGRIAKAKRGGHAIGSIPYGYRSVDGQLVIEEAEAKVVRAIFDMRNNRGWTFQAIADWLNEHNVPTRGGNPWLKVTVHTMYKNPKYGGDFSYTENGQQLASTQNDKLRLVK